MILWRISDFEDLKGTGGLHAHSRWHRRGREVVYLAESVAAALLEVLVHFDCAPGDLPRAFTLLEVEIADDAPVETLDEQVLPEGWIGEAEITRKIGDQWLAGNSALLLKVPSAVIPKSYNYLFNPLRPEAGHARIVSVSRHLYDPRLFSVS